jgi:regulator of telomere elongation helicase 1
LNWEQLFPYDPYPQQLEFMHDVEKVVGRHGVLIAEACNGFGKTISCLSCLLPLGMQIIYATRTHEQVRQVLIELENINKKSRSPFTAVNLASRDFLCLNGDCRDLPRNEAQELCNSLRKNGECDYVNEFQAVPRKLPQILSKETLLAEGRRRQVCPYFLARFMSKTCRVVVSPYPYVFNPMIRLTTGLDLEGRILILDEGHNIDQVGQDTMSDTLTEPGLGSATEEMRLIGQSPRLINRLGEHLLKTVGDKPRLVSAEKLVENLERAIGIDLNEFIDKHLPLVEPIRLKKSQMGKPPVSYLNGLLSFFELLQTSVKDKYVAVYTKNYFGAPVIEYRCLDPSLALRPLVEEAGGVLIMSGTLSPIETFSEIIGLESAVKKSYPPIQKSDKIRMVIETEVTSSYRERSVDMMTNYGKIISSALEEVDHGALLFFTQRAFMNTCLDVWQRKGFIRSSRGRMFLGDKELYREGRDARNNREVVSRYKKKTRGLRGAVLCCVFRGRNSEGSNFPDDEARAIFLVGVPYANYGDPLVKAQIKYFNSVKRGLGNEWYTMDAFRAANQSLGRGIRGREDWCQYWLLDRRYYEKIDLLSPWAVGSSPRIVGDYKANQQTL